MTAIKSLKTLALVSTFALASAANAATLYSQPYDGAGNLYSSQNDVGGGNGNFATSYDSFTLGGSSTVTGVSFTGGFFNPDQTAPINNFTVNFYSNSGGTPGALLQTNTISGNGGQAGCADSGTATICNYNVAVNFSATASTKYWMSIVAGVDFPPQWGWATGTGGDGTAYQTFFGTPGVLPADLAFTLTGNAAGGVPEPATWALMLGGFGFVGAAMRRRARTNVSFA